MANLDELFSALQKADAAGNFEDAKQLAGIIQQQGGFEFAPLPKPKKGLLAAGERGARSLLGSLQTGLESLLPQENAAANAALRGLQRQEELGQEIEAPASLERVKEAYRKKGVLSAAGEVISQVPGAIVEQVPQIGAMVAGARIGRRAGPWGALIGAATPVLAQFYGSNLQRQAQEQVATGTPVDVDRGKAALAAAPQAALDIVQQRLVFGSKLFSSVLGIPEKELLKKSAQQVEKLAQEKLLPTLLYGTAKGVAAEIPTEIGQQMIERAQAGLSLTSPDALAEYGDTAYQVGLLGPLGAVGRISEKGAARQEVARREAEALAAQQAANTGLPPSQTAPAQRPVPPTIPGAPTQASFLEAGPTPPAPPIAEAVDPNLLPQLRQQYDTIDREIDRLAQQFQAEQDPAKKLAIKVQAQKLDYARQELESQLQGAPARPGVAPVEGQAELDFTAPLPKDRLQAEPTIIGEQKAAPNTEAAQLELLKQRRNAGMALTPAEQFMLREAEKAEQAQLQARPTPELIIPTEVGAGARPTSFVVDDRAINTFGFSKKATKIKDAIRGLDLMKPEDKAKFDELIAKHEYKPGAKIDMQAVEDFKAAMPQLVPAREVPEAAGLPAREYTSRQQYQQAREAMFAFGQEAAPISPRDRAILAKQQYEAENGPISDVGTGASEPSVSVPSGELESTAGITTPTATGLAGAEPVARRPAARKGPAGKAQPSALDPFAQMVQQVAPEDKPDLQAEKKAKKKLGFGEVEKPAPTRKGTAYRTTGPNMDGMSVRDVQGVVNRIIDGWKNSPLIQVVQFENQLPQAVQDQIKRDGVIRPQGLWDEDTQAVYLIADNLVSPKDVGLTVAHEALGHYGLRTILGENYSKVMNQMYENAEVKRRADNKIDRGMDKETAVEEVLAEMAEQQVPPTVIQKLINIVRQLMAKAGFPMKGVTSGEIKQLLENARQYVIEGKGEAGKGGMKVGKVFSGDAPIFYSKLAAMTQHAPKNLRDGASGKQWADWINSNAGKFGVKKEELEWTGINDELALFTTKLDLGAVSRFIDMNKVGIDEVMHGGPKDEAKIQELNDKLRESKILHKQLIKQIFKEGMSVKSVFSPEFIEAFTTPQGKFATMDAFNNLVNNTSAELKSDFLRDPSSWTVMQNEDFETFGIYDRDLDYGVHEDFRTPEQARARLDDIKDAYRNRAQAFDPEPIIRSQKLIETYEKFLAEEEKGYTKPTRFDTWSTHGGKNYGELVLRLPSIKVDYRHQGHWPKVTNPVVHTRFSEFTDADGKRVLLVDEVQSDWGQQSTKYGVGTEEGMAKYRGNLNAAIEEANRLSEILNTVRAEAVAQGKMQDVFDAGTPEVEQAYTEYRKAQDKVNELSTYPPVPNAPFIKDTKAWTALVVKRLLRYAADNGISRIAFIDGQTAFERFPKDEDGNSTEKGMRAYYDQILPSVVKEVLHKLGADSKPIRSDIETEARPGYSVFVDGELVAGPYDSERDATDAGADLVFSGMVEDSDSVKIKVTQDQRFKSFMAFDIAPETAERVKEGQAMFRSAGTAAGQQAEQDMAAFGGKNEAKQESYVAKKQQSFNKAKEVWQESYERNESRVAATFGKGQNIASFDQAFNNRLYNHFANLKKNGNMLMEQMKSELLLVSNSQALHRGNLANQIIDRGNYKYDATTNRWIAVDDPINMKRFETLARSLATKLGVSPNRARQIMGAAYEANRLNDMYQDLSKAKAELTRAENALPTIKDAKLRATKKELIKALEAKVEELTDKVQHKTYNEVQAGMRLYNSQPEIKEGTEVWNTMRKRVVQMLVDTGVKTEEQAQKWLDEAAYVPFFRDMEEEKAAGPQVVARGIRESMKDYRLKGSQREVNDVIENMYQWMQWSIARGISNNQLQVMADTYKKYLPEEIKEGKGDKASTFTIYRDGVPKFYNVADPAIAQAFMGLEPIVFPAIQWFASSSNFLRHAVTRIPIFPVVQLFNDSYNAMFVSGLKSPFQLLKEIAKETVATARGTSETRELLKQTGILETHDYNALNEAEAIGQRLNLEEPGAWAKLAQSLDRFSSASDNIIRQGIYNQSRKEGLSHVEAMEKAAEVVNFRRLSGDPRIQFLSRIVPFFNAYTQVASVAVKTLTGRGISPQERDVAAKVLIATTAKVAALSMIYSMAIGDDEEYQRKNRVSRDRMFMIPGSGGLGVPIRMDLFAIPKLAGEYGYQLMSDSAFTDPKMAREAIARAIKGSLNPPSEGIPQLIRPALGVMMNHDAFQDREIINATMRRLDPEQQFTKNTSEIAKALGAMTGISPLNLDFLFRGYLGSVATLTSLATNDIINAARGGAPRPDRSVNDILASLPNMGAMMSKDDNTAVLTDFYEVARDVNKANATYGNLKYAPKEERDAYREEHKVEIALKARVQAVNNQLVVLKRREQMIRQMPEEKMSGEQKQEALKKIDEQRSRMMQNIMKIRKQLYG
jgi:hypothetical protein